MHGIVIRDRTTPNVVKAKLRKKRNREKRLAADIAEAVRLGISVDELRFRRVKEAQEIIQAQKNKTRQQELISSQSYSRYRYW